MRGGSLRLNARINSARLRVAAESVSELSLDIKSPTGLRPVVYAGSQTTTNA